ncbi:nucleotidyltransferase, partial [Listeria monocytogenes]|nr:nucleotidyltransferase [Listeria monocytogenes]
TNNDKGKFIKMAKKAYNLLKDISANSDDVITKLRELLGKEFAKTVVENKASLSTRLAPNEELPESKFIVDVRYNLKLDYTVEQEGFRPKKMSYFTNNKYKLKAKKNLNFYIESIDIPDYLLPSVEWYWKVRNIGPEAIRKNCERGQIRKGSIKHQESTAFNGEHYVECYAVIGRRMIAKGRAKVPIDITYGID